jgi:hypothetical protein
MRGGSVAVGDVGEVREEDGFLPMSAVVRGEEIGCGA